MTTPFEIRQILVPVDFKPHSAAALRAAESLAGDKAQITLLHVIEHPVYPQAYDLPHDELLWPQAIDQIEAALERFAKAEGAGRAKPRIEVHDGRAASVIVELAAARGSDLIVMGTHGAKGLDRFFLGSVAEKVVRMAGCAVMIVKSDAGETAADGD